MRDDLVFLQCPHCTERLELELEWDRRGTIETTCPGCGEGFRVLVSRDEWGDPDVRVER